jgi:hypothetical protein
MSVFKAVAFALTAALSLTSAAFADDGDWVVRKATGEVWTRPDGVQPVSLGQDTVLKPGDTVTTGRNGRVLLVRGQETILIAPNSVVGIPAEKKDGLATTITQQAGSILLEVEKKNVPHFEVETPYLAAVVKGTQFRVSVTPAGARVEVTRGQVEVADFKSGQIAQVLPGQAAQTFTHGSQGLSLSGTGAFRPIEQGAPRDSRLTPINVPKGGLQAPQGLDRAQMRAAERAQERGVKTAARHAHHGVQTPRAGVVRIAAPLGELRVNFHKVTHGLARNASAPSHAAGGREATIWSSDTSTSLASTANSASGAAVSASGNFNSGGASAASAGGASASAAAVAAGSSSNGNSSDSSSKAAGNGNGNGSNGNNGNHGNGNNGNHNGNGNGNGNGGNGNGNGNGNGKNKT